LISHPTEQDDLLSRSEFLALPIYSYEIVHMAAYQSQLFERYARLRCILEMDKLVSEHAAREAFSQEEINHTKHRLSQVTSFKDQLEDKWTELRWIKDATSFARDNNAGLLISSIVKKSAKFRSRPLNTSQNSPKIFDYPSPTLTPSSLDFHNSSSNLTQTRSERSRHSKSEERSQERSGKGMKKSCTAENIRISPKAEISFVKSKTSECLYHRNSYESDIDSKVTMDACLCPKSRISNEIKPNMYSNDKVSRSDYHLQEAKSPTIVLPRKSSAPLYLDNMDSDIFSNNLKSDKYPKATLSVESIIGIPATRKRKDLVSDYKDHSKNSLHSHPTNFELPPRPSVNLDAQRANSSLSHESENSFSSIASSMKSLSSTETEIDTLSLLSRESYRSETSDSRSILDGDDKPRRAEEQAIFQVYAAYESGLSNGVSVKLHVTSKTTAREVIDMVVKELNRTVISKRKKGPTYSNDQLKNFCLVAVIDKRERILRDDFKLLSIQDPWRRGKFYVRFRYDILAAIEQSTARQPSSRRPTPPVPFLPISGSHPVSPESLSPTAYPSRSMQSRATEDVMSKVDKVDDME